MPLALAEFNIANPDELRPLLHACLAVPRWGEVVLLGRPYAELSALVGAAESASPLLPGEIAAAIAAHPRIGEKASGSGTGAGWSRSEQSGVDEAAAREFADANIDYETRFGHVYLVCASGRSGEELLADLRSRLDNDPGTELAVAGRELAKIAVLRLQKAVTA
ncbi:2-oxo-4-hydroxy-4-carboxy-5-ureidoimidazoline decarboxylase [Amycolatopsis sp. H20-H5]|uniref:2-oxo-4-hydroxy-4-carboxy-5-ureidoimidazoline decarboxylase n=1 Tax=Amycolatopsis sp. H20-H5 TaxID=3046309 RepID=UPI002DBA2E45|nr:2-oxo-4-hydroxy-4-carboxy-5-ureidoimidazoline decarboxylase [Amycolatopsis sp. H20-H5]MEC3976356.1 2-oxo-4-hydroxy-4-carboxy-5-ureidoimidazoline decarboxylase [Amycolatopsis sp. H20-H5]